MMNHERTYLRICAHFKANPASPCERHHIVPKACGGSDDEDNIVHLSPRAHLVCHKLLPKFLVGEAKTAMLRALWFMSINGKHDKPLTSREYENLREEMRKGQSELSKVLWQDETFRAKQSARMRKQLKAQWQDPGYRQRNVERTKKTWSNPEKRKSMGKRASVAVRKHIVKHPEFCAKSSVNATKHWSDPQQRKRQSEYKKAWWAEWRHKKMMEQEGAQS